MIFSQIRSYHSSVLSFRKNGDNMLQSYKKTYGINSSIAKLFCAHIGCSTEYQVRSVPMNYLTDNLKKLLVSKTSHLSSSLRKQVEDNLSIKIKLRTYEGNCLKNKLPMRGQRRRTNATTAKKLLGQFLIKSRK